MAHVRAHGARGAAWLLVAAGAAFVGTGPGAAAPAAPACHGHRATVWHAGSAGGPLVGTAADDVIVGGPGKDKIRGRGGDDLICGLAGDDTIVGGQGDDRVDAGGGDDRATGGGGDDRLAGKSGDDTLSGGGGSNRLDGGTGTDVCTGSPGDKLKSCNEGEALPQAVADVATASEDSTVAVTIDVLANDTDADGGPRSVQAVTQPPHGTVVITGGGAGVTYLPNAGYCNDGSPTDNFTYTLAPGGSTATVAVTVLCGDDPPTAVDDTKTVGEDAVATAINVLANDTDADGGPRSVQTVTQPGHGTVAITGGGSGVTYLPNANYCNDGSPTDDFTYTLAPGGSTASVAVTVTCVDDAPTAVGDAPTVAEDAAATAIDVLGNDTDPDGGPRSISTTTQPTHGTVAVTGGGSGLTYVPDPDYCNDGTPTDDFTYTLSPGSSTATVKVTVSCVDDAPTAVDDTATVAGDSAATAIDVLANDSDIDGGPRTVQTVTQPVHGTVVITGGGAGLTYQPNAGYCNGGSPTDDFTYTLAQGGTTATVAMTVSCLSATISPNPDVIAAGTLGVPISRSYTATNTGPAFTGRVQAGPVSSARVARPTIADAASQQFQVNVLPGATSVSAGIGNPADTGADLDLFLYNCTTGTCVLAAQSATGSATESVSVNNPAAGVWVVLVNGFGVPSGTTAYDYFDAFTSPAFGQLAVADNNAVRAAGSSWTVSATLQPTAVPAAGRVLRATTRVVTSAGTVLATGVVIVQSMS